MRDIAVEYMKKEMENRFKLEREMAKELQLDEDFCIVSKDRLIELMAEEFKLMALNYLSVDRDWDGYNLAIDEYKRGYCLIDNIDWTRTFVKNKDEQKDLYQVLPRITFRDMAKNEWRKKYDENYNI